MLFSSLTRMMLSGRLRSVFAHEKSADVALRTCSNCHTSRLVVRSLAFETTVKWALLTSIQSSAAATGATAQADRRTVKRHNRGSEPPHARHSPTTGDVTHPIC